MYRIILFVVLLAGLAGCKKNSTGTQHSGTLADSISCTLIGSWNWVLTYNNGVYSGDYTGSYTADSSTPATTGIHQLLTFNTDATWTLVQNNRTIEQGTFKIDTLISPEGPDPMLDLIRTAGQDSMLNHLIQNDTLILSNPHVVGASRNWVYVKVNVNSSPD
jgi:hypothetical protein